MSLPAAIDHLGRELLLEFYWTYSALEYGLKRGGFLRSSHDGVASPDWNRFGVALRGSFTHVASPDFHQAVTEIAELSPRRQVVRNGQLAWAAAQPRGADSVEEYTLKLLRTVRNNLFHGGKYPDATAAELSRDRTILRVSVVVLGALPAMHPEVARHVSAPAEASSESRSHLRELQ